MTSLERTLNQDMAIISSYLQKWRLKLSKTKAVSTVFHLNNKEAKRKLDIMVEETICLKTATAAIKVKRVG